MRNQRGARGAKRGETGEVAKVTGNIKMERLLDWHSTKERDARRKIRRREATKAEITIKPPW